MIKKPQYSQPYKKAPPFKPREPSIIIPLPVVDENNLINFYKAIVENDVQSAQIELNINPEIINIPNKIDNKIEYPLHTALESNTFDKTTMIKFLLKKNAFVNAKNEKNETPLHLAAKLQDSDVVELLVKKNANVNAIDITNRSPLDFAINIFNSIDCPTNLKQEPEPLIEPTTKTVSNSSIVELNKKIVDEIETKSNNTIISEIKDLLVENTDSFFKDEFEQLDKSLLESLIEKLKNPNLSDDDKKNLQNVAFEFKKMIVSKLDNLYNIKSINQNSELDEKKLLTEWKTDNQNRINDSVKSYNDTLVNIQNINNDISNEFTKSKNDLEDVIYLNYASYMNNNSNLVLNINTLTQIFSPPSQYNIDENDIKNNVDNAITNTYNNNAMHNNQITNKNNFYTKNMDKLQKNDNPGQIIDTSTSGPLVNYTLTYDIPNQISIVSILLYFTNRINANITKLSNLLSNPNNYTTYQTTIPNIILYTFNLIIIIYHCKKFITDNMQKLNNLHTTIMDLYNKEKNNIQQPYLLYNMAFITNKIIKNITDQQKKLDDIYKQCQIIIDSINKYISNYNDYYAFKFIENKATYSGLEMPFKQISQLPDLNTLIKEMNNTLDKNYFYAEYFPQINNNYELNFVDETTTTSLQHGIIIDNTKSSINFSSNIILKDGTPFTKIGIIGQTTSKNDYFKIIGTNITKYIEYLKTIIINNIINNMTDLKDKITATIPDTDKDNVYNTILIDSTDNVLNYFIKKNYNNFANKYVNDKTKKSSPSIGLSLQINDSVTYEDYGFKLELNNLIDRVINKMDTNRIALLNIGNLNEQNPASNIRKILNYSPDLDKTDDKCYKSDFSIIKTLVTKNADINKQDNLGQMYIHLAVEQLNNNLVDLILSKKPNSKEYKYREETPKQIAVKNYLEYLNEFSLDIATKKFNKKIRNEILSNDIFKKNILKYTGIILPFTIVLINGLFYSKITNNLDFIPLIQEEKGKVIDFTKEYQQSYIDTVNQLDKVSKFHTNISAPIVPNFNLNTKTFDINNLKTYEDIFDEISSNKKDFKTINLRFYTELWKSYIDDSKQMENDSNIHLEFVKKQKEYFMKNEEKSDTDLKELDDIVKKSDEMNQISNDYLSLPYSINLIQQYVVKCIAHVLKHTILTDYYYVIAKALYKYSESIKQKGISLSMENTINNDMFTNYLFNIMPEEIIRIHYKLFNDADPLENIPLEEVFENTIKILMKEKNSFTDKINEIIVPFFTQYVVIILNNLKPSIDTYFKNIQYENINLKIINKL